MTRSLNAVRFVLIACVGAGLAACGDDDAQPNLNPDAGPRLDAGTSDDGGNKPASDAGAHDAGAHERDADVAVSDAAANDEDDAGYHDEDDGGTGPEADFYPLTDGSRWVYRHNGGNTEWDEKVHVSDTNYQGKKASLLEDSPGPSGTHSKTILGTKGTLVLRIHREEFEDDTLKTVADYDPGFPRFDSRWVRASVGYSEKLDYHRTEADGDGTVTADGNRSHTYTVKSRTATLKVPAGTFEGCLQVLRSRERKAGATAGEGDEDMFWFCSGIGKVREEDQVTGETEELVSCSVPDGSCP